MFWKFGFHAQSAIDNILDRETFTLEELLDEDDILQETKSNNKRLVDFLSQPETLHRLLEYCTLPPDPELNERQQYKYPSLASEILSSEVWAINDSLSSNLALLDILFKFLDNPAPLNPLLASFFAKVACMLLGKKSIETIQYLRSHPSILEKLLTHLGTSAIKDLLIRVCAPVDYQEKEVTVAWLQEEKFISRLVSRFSKDYDDNVLDNASGALIEIIQACHDPNFAAPPTEIIEELQEQEHITTLVNFLLESPSTSALPILSLFLSLIDHKRETPQVVEEGRPGSPASMDQAFMDQQSPLHPEKVVPYFIPHLKDFQALLETKNSTATPLPLTSGRLEPPLGAVRLKVVRFFSALFRSNIPEVHKELANLHVLRTIIDLFFAYPWNNFLHLLVQDIIDAIFSKNAADNERSPLLVSLFKDCDLLERIIEIFKTNHLSENLQLNPSRQGFMGHITYIANMISESFKEDNTTLLGEALVARWTQFAETDLAAINSANKQTLGGPKPTAAEESDEEEIFDNRIDDDDDENNPAEIAFNRYLNNQYSFDTNLGLEDEEDDSTNDDLRFGSADPFGVASTIETEDNSLGSVRFQRAQANALGSEDEDEDDEDDRSSDEEDHRFSSQPTTTHHNETSSDDSEEDDEDEGQQPMRKRTASLVQEGGDHASSVAAAAGADPFGAWAKFDSSVDATKATSESESDGEEQEQEQQHEQQQEEEGEEEQQVDDSSATTTVASGTFVFTSGPTQDESDDTATTSSDDIFESLNTKATAEATDAAAAVEEKAADAELQQEQQVQQEQHEEQQQEQQQEQQNEQQQEQQEEAQAEVAADVESLKAKSVESLNNVGQDSQQSEEAAVVVDDSSVNHIVSVDVVVPVGGKEGESASEAAPASTISAEVDELETRERSLSLSERNDEAEDTSDC